MTSYTDLPPRQFAEAPENMHLISDWLDKPTYVMELPSLRQFAITLSEDELFEVAHFGLDGRYAEDVEWASNLLVRVMEHVLRPGKLPLTFWGFVAHGSYYFYDIEYNGQSQGAVASYQVFNSFSVPVVPVLSDEHRPLSAWLNRRSLTLAAYDGKSHIPLFGERAGILVRQAYEPGDIVVLSCS